MRQRTCYVAGPMRGYPLFNFPAFDAAEKMLREEGWEVISPAALDRAEGFDEHKDGDFTGRSLDAAIRRDMAAIMSLRPVDPSVDDPGDAVVLLPGWEKSVGATAEVALARWRGIRVVYMPGADPALRPAIPTAAEERKEVPLASGVLDYFPDALAEVARVSLQGNKQHHPDKPLHWDKSKSTDEADALLRHLVDRGKRDVDGMRHTAKVAWRGLALLQRELDAEKGVK